MPLILRNLRIRGGFTITDAGPWYQQQGAFAFGLANALATSALNVVNRMSNVGVIAADAGTSASTIKYGVAGASYGGDKGIFGFGRTAAPTGGTDQSTTNLMTNTGTIGVDVTGVGTARYELAACGYGADKAIFGFGGAIPAGVIGVTNLVSNTGVVSTDTAAVGTARTSLSAAKYGGDKGIFIYGYKSGTQTMVNLVSNTGVVATDSAGAGTARTSGAASSYGHTKAIFGFGYVSGGGGYLSTTNLISDTGVFTNDIAGVGSIRIGLAATVYNANKCAFAYGSSTTTTNTCTNISNRVSELGVVATDTTGVGSVRFLLGAASYGSA